MNNMLADDIDVSVFPDVVKEKLRWQVDDWLCTESKHKKQHDGNNCGIFICHVCSV